VLKGKLGDGPLNAQLEGIPVERVIVRILLGTSSLGLAAGVPQL
jgi:hypothetical protein